MDQPRNVRKKAKWHNLFNERGHKLSPLEDGGTIYFPSLDEFFAPLVDLNRLENMVYTNFKVSDYQIMSEGLPVKPLNREPVSEVTGPVNIGHGITIKIPRRGSFSQYEPDWQKYLLDRQLQVKPTFSSTAKRANLWPLAGKDSEYCVPNMLGYANLSYLSNRVAPFVIPAGTYDTITVERVFYETQDTGRSKQWYRYVDMQAMCAAVDVTHFYEAPARIMAIIYGMCYALTNTGFFFDVITEDDNTVSHTFDQPYELTGADMHAMSNYLLRTTPFDIHVLGELLYPRYANVNNTWHNEAAASPLPSSRVWAVPTYNVVDHILTLGIGNSNLTFHSSVLRGHVATLRMLMLQVARYMGGDPLIKHQAFGFRTLDGNRNIFITQSWAAGVTVYQDYVPMELILFYGGNVPEAKKFYGGSQFDMTDVDVQVVQGMPFADGVQSRVLCIAPRSLFVCSRYITVGSISFYNGRGVSIVNPRPNVANLISPCVPFSTYRSFGKDLDGYGIENFGGAALGRIIWDKGPSTFALPASIEIPDSGLNW